MPHEAKPILCYVTDRHSLSRSAGSAPASASSDLLSVIRRAIAAGVDWIQIRERDLPTHSLLELAQQAVAVSRSAGSAGCILVNDRLDVALAAGAGGVHLGSQSLPVAEAKRWCRGGHAPAGFLVGASCHSLDEALTAERDGADYIIFGPVFATPSKLSYGPPQGIAKLAEVCRSVRIPVLAIGGVTLENAAKCLRASAAGIAAIRLFQQATDLAALVTQLKRLGQASGQKRAQ